MLGKKGANQFTKAARDGLTKPVVAKETTQKILATKIKNGTLARSAESRKKTSESMKLAVANNPDAYTSSNRGRTKQIIEDGIKFQGKWELEFYRWAQNVGLQPHRATTGFEYEWNGTRTYFPDFYIESMDLYVEVKGYETDRDRAKWLHFPGKLRIIREQDIYAIRKGTFSGL